MAAVIREQIPIALEIQTITLKRGNNCGSEFAKLKGTQDGHGTVGYVH